MNFENGLDFFALNALENIALEISNAAEKSILIAHFQKTKVTGFIPSLKAKTIPPHPDDSSLIALVAASYTTSLGFRTRPRKFS